MAVRVDIPGVEVLTELAQGAYSVSYVARIGETPCVLKLPRGRGRWTRWAYREALTLARVRHPALPRVIEVGEVQDLPYLVTERVEGETLEDRLDRGPLSERRAFQVIEQVVDALSALHAVGLVHRDVRPQTILLEPSGDVRLVDLSFAAHLGRKVEASHSYIAPELLSSPAQVDPRTDLYSVGQLLRELLPGRADAAFMAAGLLSRAPHDRYPDAPAVLAELTRVRGEAAPLGPRAYRAAPLSSKLVGRTDETEQLARAWAAAREGAGSAMVVAGPRGSGKTRLLGAFAASVRASSRGRVIEAHCRDGDPPLALLQRILDAFAERLDGGPAEAAAADRAALVEAAAHNGSGFATLIAPRLRDVLGGTEGVEVAPGGFPEGAAAFFVRLARAAGPLLVCIDDVQYIDPISRQVLARLTAQVGSAPLLLALTVRSSGASASTADLDGKQVSYIDLFPMDEDDVAELVANHLGENAPRSDLARWVGKLSDGTPLGALEVLSAALDLGALRPRQGSWISDSARLEELVLPDGSLALLRRRLDDLPPATRRVLETAAIVGSVFDDSLLAEALEIAPDDLRFALVEARRAGVVEPGDRASHRFVHNTARELLAGALPTAEARAIHLRVARAYARRREPEAIHRAAVHYGEADAPDAAREALACALAAADAAVARFDNETTLRLLGIARRSAAVTGSPLASAFHKNAAEAYLRLGALDESLEHFRSSLPLEPGAEERARIYGRIAWVEQARGDPDRAWAALDAAFQALGAELPREGLRSAKVTLRMLRSARRSPQPGGSPATPPQGSRQTELLCELLYQNARLGLEHGKPYRLIASALLARRLSAELGESKTAARSRTLYGFMLTGIGLRRKGAAELEAAERLASRIGDPVVIARCTQARALAAVFEGRIDKSLALFRSCLDTYHPWLELGEYCVDAASCELVEHIRGRTNEAWSYIERVVSRQRGNYRSTAVFNQCLVHRAAAAMAALDTPIESDPWLAAELDHARKSAPPASNLYRMFSWGPRARMFLERGDLGPEFEKLTQDFAAEGYNPSSAHMVVAEYYITLCHARVHQLLRAKAADRAAPLARLESALDDLGKAAKIPLFRAHRLFVEGLVAWCKERAAEGERLFAEAEALAREETCPWVLYAVARARAHLLREAGKLEAALDQARVAESLARAHGAEPRARWVREEMGLAEPPRSTAASTTDPDRTTSTRLGPIASPARLHARPEEQATAILDAVLRELNAERGALWFEAEGGSPRILAARNRRGEELSDVDGGWRWTWLTLVRQRGDAWNTEPEDPSRVLGQPLDGRRLLGAPLHVDGKAVGAICIERSSRAPVFTPEEGQLLSLLSRQYAMSLLVVQLTTERDRLHASLRQAQKMETVGQLAGGIAHDFKNMLGVVKATFDVMVEELGAKTVLSGEHAEDVEIIRSGFDNGASMMKQLLSFARKQSAAQRACSLNDVIRELGPILRRAAGDKVSLVTTLDPQIKEVVLARPSFEQAVLNLVVNARDAMQAGGALTITTHTRAIDEISARRMGISSGAYVAVEVKDTGHGIRPEHLPQIFDPFFTTKPVGSGTGIGLTTVADFVRNSGGHIDVTSEVGKGTCFVMLFPTSVPRAPAGDSGPQTAKTDPDALAAHPGVPKLAS